MTLAHYIRDLVAALRQSDPPAYQRLREVVGDRRARITLDQETALPVFDRGELRFLSPGSEVDGEGSTDRETVHDLLDGRLEVSEAILLGRIEIRGPSADVDRILLAVELLLDGSTRAPAMRALAGRFCAERPRRHPPVDPPPMNGYPFRLDGEEFAMLARLDLLS
jgi:hypothetical protein